jgi:hypothetical protein
MRLVAQQHGAGQDRVERRLVLRIVFDPLHDRRLRVGEKATSCVVSAATIAAGPFERAQIGNAEPRSRACLAFSRLVRLSARSQRPSNSTAGWPPGTFGLRAGAARLLGLGVHQVEDGVQVIQPRLAVVLQRPHHL